MKLIGMREFGKDKKGVFGLTAVQQFFAIILSIALLAYIIVIILGTLGGTTILEKTSATVVNESGYVNVTGYYLDNYDTPGFSGAEITSIINASSNLVIVAANYSLTNGYLTNATPQVWDNVNITYTYRLYTVQQNRLDAILVNTSTGVSGFFGSINPVFVILAVLVIILILVVLVRVVQAPSASGRESAQL